MVVDILYPKNKNINLKLRENKRRGFIKEFLKNRIYELNT